MQQRAQCSCMADVTKHSALKCFIKCSGHASEDGCTPASDMAWATPSATTASHPSARAMPSVSQATSLGAMAPDDAEWRLAELCQLSGWKQRLYGRSRVTFAALMRRAPETCTQSLALSQQASVLTKDLALTLTFVSYAGDFVMQPCPLGDQCELYGSCCQMACAIKQLGWTPQGESLSADVRQTTSCSASLAETQFGRVERLCVPQVSTEGAALVSPCMYGTMGT